MFITPDQSTGNLVSMRTNHPLHYSEDGRINKSSSASSGSFADMLNNAIGQVNGMLTESDNLTQKMIHEPESVEIHSVMIAAQKAEIALNFTRAVRDEVIKSYRELINLR